MSEGARWKGYEIKEYGEPDAFGHRKKFSVAEAFSDEIIARTKAETVVSDLTYDLRSGAPDFLDNLVATTFGTMAYDAITGGDFGKMTAIADGKFEMVPIPDPKLGPRKVDIDKHVNAERYRPDLHQQNGFARFLDARLSVYDDAGHASNRECPFQKQWRHKGTSSIRTLWSAFSIRSWNSAAVSRWSIFPLGGRTAIRRGCG